MKRLLLLSEVTLTRGHSMNRTQKELDEQANALMAEINSACELTTEQERTS